MFMFVAYPWPVPSANIEPPGSKAAEAATRLPDARAEPSTRRPMQVEDLVSWTGRERLRLLWYQLRFTATGIRHPSHRADRPRLKLP